jgi:hypothetical protein
LGRGNSTFYDYVQAREAVVRQRTEDMIFARLRDLDPADDSSDEPPYGFCELRRRANDTDSLENEKASRKYTTYMLELIFKALKQLITVVEEAKHGE